MEGNLWDQTLKLNINVAAGGSSYSTGLQEVPREVQRICVVFGGKGRTRLHMLGGLRGRRGSELAQSWVGWGWL